MYEDRCLICGETVPEGRDVCPDCVNRIGNGRPVEVTVRILPRNQMRVEDIRRVLVNFIRQMPRAYRRRNANATVVRDIILKGTGYAGFESCCTICEAIGCDPMAYEFPEWSLEDMGGRKEVRGDAAD